MDIMYKMEDEEYSKLFVTSDTHFLHNKEFIYAHRGYSDAKTMTDDMIDIINQTVGSDGILLHLGDFCLNSMIGDYINILSRLKIGGLWMLNGNHNNPHRRFEHQENGFLFVKKLGDYFSFRNRRREFVCFHFPIAVWDGAGKNVMHLCGHSHGSYKLSLPDDKQQKILDCGWCVHRRPLAIQEVVDIMDKKGTNTQHHAKF